MQRSFTHQMTDSKSQLAIQIASSQQRTKWFVFIFFIVLFVSAIIIVVLMNGAAVSQGRYPKPDIVSEVANGSSLQSEAFEKQVALSLVVGEAEDQRTIEKLEELRDGAKSLRDDQEFGFVAKKFLVALDTASVTPNDEKNLIDALKKRTQSIDSGLEEAFQLHNKTFIARIAKSEFFQNHGAKRMLRWDWISTSEMRDYELAIEKLKSAIVTQSLEQELAALIDVRKLTSLNYHDERIAHLTLTISQSREKQLQDDFAIMLANKNYQQIVEKAEKLQSEVSSDSNLLDIVRQAKVGLKSEALDDTLRRAKSASKADEWLKVVDLLKSIPSNQRDEVAVALGEQAKSVIRYQAVILRLLESPERLVDSSVKDYAGKQLSEAEAYASLSPRLAKSAGNLKDALGTSEVMARLDIVSDNRATILIVGEGYIKPTRSKSLKIPMKKHRFIVRCSGKEDVIQDIDLSTTAPDKAVEVRLDCAR